MAGGSGIGGPRPNVPKKGLPRALGARMPVWTRGGGMRAAGGTEACRAEGIGAAPGVPDKRVERCRRISAPKPFADTRADHPNRATAKHADYPSHGAVLFGRRNFCVGTRTKHEPSFRGCLGTFGAPDMPLASGGETGSQ